MQSCHDPWPWEHRSQPSLPQAAQCLVCVSFLTVIMGTSPSMRMVQRSSRNHKALPHAFWVLSICKTSTDLCEAAIQPADNLVAKQPSGPCKRHFAGSNSSPLLRHILCMEVCWCFPEPLG